MTERNISERVAANVAARIEIQLAKGVRHVVIAGAELDAVLYALRRALGEQAPSKKTI